MRMSRRIAAVAALGALIMGFRRYRRWHLQWGATDDEARRFLPGDELIEDPHFAPTRAMTIDAAPEAVWPWLVQIGYGRAGSKPASSWAWVLERLPGERTRLITRVRMRYRWRRPTVVADLVLMELGDFWMMRKELRSIGERAEHETSTAARVAGGGGV